MSSVNSPLFSLPRTGLHPHLFPILPSASLQTCISGSGRGSWMPFLLHHSPQSCCLVGVMKAFLQRDLSYAEIQRILYYAGVLFPVLTWFSDNSAEQWLSHFQISWASRVNAFYWLKTLNASATKRNLFRGGGREGNGKWRAGKYQTLKVHLWMFHLSGLRATHALD